mgnify:CR=1 FL=1
MPFPNGIWREGNDLLKDKEAISIVKSLGKTQKKFLIEGFRVQHDACDQSGENDLWD